MFPLCLPIDSHSLQSKEKNFICGDHIHPSVYGLVAVQKVVEQVSV
jgi:hypothetical protein